MYLGKLSVDCDISEIALLEAARPLGSPPLGELTLYCSVDWRVNARRLQATHGFELVLMPELMAAGRWCVEHRRGVVWSRTC